MSKDKLLLIILFFFLPFTIMLGLSILPTVYSVYLSFFQGMMENFVGFNNYLYLPRDQRFIDAIQVTFKFTAITVISQTVIGLIIAYMLFQPEARYKGVWQTLFILPLAIPPVVAGVMFKILYHPSFGPSGFLSLFGISPPLWLEDPNLALFSVSVINIWMWTPFTFLVFYTGLRAIPGEIIESASIDGASGLTIFTKIIYPHLKMLILVIIIFRTMENVLAFDEIMGSTAGGPGFTTTTIAMYVYKIAFKSWDLGYASSISTILFVVIIVFIIFSIKLAYLRE
ncbi:MAG: carbohydrate ABC transporter permease [Nitrososphaeria archaeon]